MKKLLILISFCCLSVLFTTEVAAQNRNVFWLYGHNEECSDYALTNQLYTDFWGAYANQFQSERRIISKSRSSTSSSGYLYSSQNDIPSEAQYLHNVELSPMSQAIIIGHSQGGIMARSMNRQFPSSDRIAGIISVGSPHQGVELLRSNDRGLVLSAVRNGVYDLLAGPTASLGILIGNLTAGAGLGFQFAWNSTSLIQSLSLANAAVNSSFSLVPAALVNLISVELLAPVFYQALATSSALSDPNPTGTNQQKPSSTVLNDLNSFSTSIPRIGIYGAANYQSALRLSGSSNIITQYYNSSRDFVVSGNTYKQYYDYRGIEKFKDDNLVTAVGIVEGIYWTASAACFIQGGAVVAVSGFVNPFGWLYALSLGYAGTQWIRGATLLGHRAQAEYVNLIGADRTEYVCEDVWVAVPDNTCQSPNPLDCEPTMVKQQRCYNRHISESNDGFLNQTTQQMPVGTNPTNFFGNFRAVGANHFTEGNHESVRRTLNFIFDDPINRAPFFLQK